MAVCVVERLRRYKEALLEMSKHHLSTGGGAPEA